MPKKVSGSSGTIGVRSSELHKRIADLVAANKGKITLSGFVRAAVEEKLDRVKSGQDAGVTLRP